MSKKNPGITPITRPHLPDLDQFSALVADLFETRMLSNFGKYTRLLEERAAAILDHPAPQSVSSCDIGLTLAWRALECPPGEVIVPSFTFCSTVNALCWNGLEPVFAEVDPSTCCIDVEDARRLITPRTVGIAAVHVFGLPAAIGPLEQLAHDHGLKLVFDAAHGLGGRYDGTALGAFGDASAFSMSGTKLVTSGEGGLVTFRDPADAERFSFLRVYGFKGDYNCRYVGMNGKLSELNAALGWLSLDMLDEALVKRHAHVEHYQSALADCPEITWQAIPHGCVHGFKDLAIRFRTPQQARRCRDHPRGRWGHDETVFLSRPSNGGLPAARQARIAAHRCAPRSAAVHSALSRSAGPTHRDHRPIDPCNGAGNGDEDSRCLNAISAKDRHRAGTAAVILAQIFVKSRFSAILSPSLTVEYR